MITLKYSLYGKGRVHTWYFSFIFQFSQSQVMLYLFPKVNNGDPPSVISVQTYEIISDSQEGRKSSIK